MSTGIIISSFLSGVFGAMGLGGGSVLIIYLTSFLSMEQKEAQGINLLFFLITGLIGIIRNTKNGLVKKNHLKRIMLSALPGLIIGLALLPVIPAQLLKKFFGGALLILGLKNLFGKNKAPHRRNII